MALTTLKLPDHDFFLGISLQNKIELRNCVFLGIKNIVNKRNKKIVGSFVSLFLKR